MPAEAPAAGLPPGHRIAEYEIVRVLGAGGFGITYLAFDHRLDGPVAIKEYFPADLATRGDGWRVSATATTNRDVFAWGLDRFLDEARAIHRFRHPNVVRAHRYLEANGTAYIVMEYVEGESLKSILDRRERLPADEWRPWMEALMSGLAHVHGHGYLHRDVKPENIVVRGEDGEPVLIDFGSARVQHRDRTHTQVLTAGYAPIEQYSTGATQGPPTDIYALAAVSYRVLTGDAVPSAPDRVLRDDYKSLTERVAAADTEWLAAIDHGLTMRPEDRPGDVRTWRRSLRPATGTAAADGVITEEVDAAATAPSPPGSETGRDNQTQVSYFTLGSHSDDVLRLQGRPTRIDRGKVGGHEDWYYEYFDSDEVNISIRTRKVVGWANFDGQLKVQFLPGRNVTDADYFTLGSHGDDVLRLQGTPTSVYSYSKGGHDWRYDHARTHVRIFRRLFTSESRQWLRDQVLIGTHGVFGWWNISGQLKVQLLPGSNVTDADYFTLGSHRDDVLRLQGTPTGIRHPPSIFERETWHYGRSEVTICTRTHKVLEWSNRRGQLQVLPGDNG